MPHRTITTNWWNHASLFRWEGAERTCIARGTLQAMVGIAMSVEQDLERMVIETDGGEMFCRREIAYLSLLADRPA